MAERERLLLIGSGGFGRVVSELARETYDCAFVDDGFEVGTVICDIPVAGHISDLEKLYESYHLLVVTIGNNKLREHIYQQAMEIGYTFPNLISPSAYINGATVGNGVLLNPGVEVHHDSSVEDYALIYTNSVVRTYAKVGKRVRIGSNVTVSNEVIVGDDADIQNGETLF